MFKKGAMFGLESRALKKQFGKLFLVSFRRLTFRLVEGQQATIRQTAKGAMFGLDARIALAIFGALSVISGAALYSAIQEAKVVALLTEADNMAKAVEQYYLDTGSLPSFSASNGSQNLSAKALVAKPAGVTNWNGPYIDLKPHAINDFLVTKEYGQIGLPFRTAVDWVAVGDDVCKQSSSSCYIYIEIESIPMNIKKAIEKKLDGTDPQPAVEQTGIYRYGSGFSQIKKDIPFYPKDSPTP